MEAARTLTRLPERMRRRRFTDACEELRPLGVAYVLRHFGQSLDRADAEDVVAEVIIRFDRMDAAGRPPERLRPAFFTSTRNAALDLLRYRGVRPTAPLEAAATTIAAGPGPAERAESADDLARLREALARMRPNYREAIVLRFGLGLTVPQIAERQGISLPAAKKLVLRSTAQIRERLESIEGRGFCPELREAAKAGSLDAELGEIAEGTEAAALRAHLDHCGPCRTFLAALRSDLHELGSTALLAGLATSKLGLAARLGSALHAAAHAAAARLRLASYRAGGLGPEGSGPADLIAGGGQKLAAVCTAGAAGAATCLATGIVGPGLGVGASPHPEPHPVPPPAHVRVAPEPRHHPTVSYTAPPPAAEPASTPAAAPTARPKPRGTESHAQKKAAKTPARHGEPKPATPSQTAEAQFGFEAQATATPTAAPVEEAATSVTQSRTVEATAPTSSSGSGSGPSKGSAGRSGSQPGSEEFGFGG